MAALQARATAARPTAVFCCEEPPWGCGCHGTVAAAHITYMPVAHISHLASTYQPSRVPQPPMRSPLGTTPLLLMRDGVCARATACTITECWQTFWQALVNRAAVSRCSCSAVLLQSSALWRQCLPGNANNIPVRHWRHNLRTPQARLWAAPLVVCRPHP